MMCKLRSLHISGVGNIINCTSHINTIIISFGSEYDVKTIKIEY